MHIVVFITASSQIEAEKIVSALLERKCIACANILPGVKSLFFWQGKAECAEEVFIVIKSQRIQFSVIEEVVKEVHSYSVPEIIALPIVEGSADYLHWIDECFSESKEF